MVHVWTLSDGKAVAFQQHVDALRVRQLSRLTPILGAPVLITCVVMESGAMFRLRTPLTIARRSSATAARRLLRRHLHYADRRGQAITQSRKESSALDRPGYAFRVEALVAEQHAEVQSSVRARRSRSPRKQASGLVKPSLFACLCLRVNTIISLVGPRRPAVGCVTIAFLGARRTRLCLIDTWRSDDRGAF